LRLIPVEIATEFRVLPLLVEEDGALLIVMADPADNHALEEVAFFVDRFVMRAVAAESAVRRAIDRYYPKKLGTDPTIPDAKRPVVMPRAKIEERVMPRQVVATPISAEPPAAPPRASFIEGPKHEPLPRRKPPPPAPAPEPEPLLLTKKKPPPPKPAPTPLPTEAEQVVLLTQKRGRDRTGTLPGLQPPANAPAPVAALRAAKDRDQVARLLLEYAAQLLGRAVLFVLNKDALRGYAARGAGLDRSSVEVLQIPLSSPSLFRDAVRSRLPFRGSMPDSPQARAVGRVLGILPSADVVLLPVEVAGRVVAVLFGDQISNFIPESALQITLHEAGLAYERLILDARTRKGS
jgi:hypothetical protein